jgi:hypothetical protein
MTTIQSSVPLDSGNQAFASVQSFRMCPDSRSTSVKARLRNHPVQVKPPTFEGILRYTDTYR